MRIVGGKYKSRVLCELKGENIRPTSDMVRESLFNILQNRIYGAKFLDLFCGTGAMGIEALSRGAAFTAFKAQWALKPYRAVRLLLRLTTLIEKALPY